MTPAASLGTLISQLLLSLAPSTQPDGAFFSPALRNAAGAGGTRTCSGRDVERLLAFLDKIRSSLS
jgi:hypothetical protein